mmetsp:Transcript_56108/g.145923  ORF Transcript_56108/g.145923 Transcript_56108/m.145923 type:complete len:216 (-) Transcript_56108:529-1176(-)
MNSSMCLRLMSNFWSILRCSSARPRVAGFGEGGGSASPVTSAGRVFWKMVLARCGSSRAIRLPPPSGGGLPPMTFGGTSPCSGGCSPRGTRARCSFSVTSGCPSLVAVSISRALCCSSHLQSSSSTASSGAGGSSTMTAPMPGLGRPKTRGAASRSACRFSRSVHSLPCSPIRSSCTMSVTSSTLPLRSLISSFTLWLSSFWNWSTSLKSFWSWI